MSLVSLERSGALVSLKRPVQRCQVCGVIEEACAVVLLERSVQMLSRIGPPVYVIDW